MMVHAECALKSLRKILGPNMIKGFCISAAEIQKWKDGMHNGVKDENGKIIGKISDTTAGIYLRCCHAVWNKCVHEGYLKDVPYPFSNKKEKGLVSIPKSAKRKQSFLNVNQMTELYNLFVSILVRRIYQTRSLLIGIVSCPVLVQWVQYGRCRAIDLR